MQKPLFFEMFLFTLPSLVLGQYDMGAMGGNPMYGNPMGDNPMYRNPMGGDPMGGDPMGGNPMGGNPMGGDPMGGNPMGGDPMGGNPMGGNLMGGNPMGGDYMGGNPMGGNPMGGYENLGVPKSEGYDVSDPFGVNALPPEHKMYEMEAAGRYNPMSGSINAGGGMSGADMQMPGARQDMDMGQGRPEQGSLGMGDLSGTGSMGMGDLSGTGSMGMGDMPGMGSMGMGDMAGLGGMGMGKTGGLGEMPLDMGIGLQNRDQSNMENMGMFSDRGDTSGQFGMGPEQMSMGSRRLGSGGLGRMGPEQIAPETKRIPEKCQPTNTELLYRHCCVLAPFFKREIARSCGATFSINFIDRNLNISGFRRNTMTGCKHWRCVLNKYKLLNKDDTLNEDKYYTHLERWVETNSEFANIILQAKVACKQVYRFKMPLNVCKFFDFNGCIRNYITVNCPKILKTKECFEQKQFYTECREYYQV